MRNGSQMLAAFTIPSLRSSSPMSTCRKQALYFVCHKCPWERDGFPIAKCIRIPLPCISNISRKCRTLGHIAGQHFVKNVFSRERESQGGIENISLEMGGLRKMVRIWTQDMIPIGTTPFTNFLRLYLQINYIQKK